MARVPIRVFDTTLRDGEQSPGCSMTLPEKLRMARQLDRLGVDVIEAGFPIASEGDFAAVSAVAREIRRPIIAGLARAKQEDIVRAWEALQSAARPRIHIFLATSDIHLEYKLKITRAQAIAHTREAITFARGLCPDVEFSPEDATRSDTGFLCDVLQVAVDCGATTLNIPDTVGYAVPREYGRLFETIRARVRPRPEEPYALSAHCHNDLGLAVANTLAALEAGARQVECTVNGIGERAGNASLEEIVMACTVRSEALPFATGVCSAELHRTSQVLSEIVGFAVQPNKAIVGRNAFAHEAGIHQHGMLSNPLCYEIMTPASVGAPGTQLVLGKHSGRHALAVRCQELGAPVSGPLLDDLYRRFTALADRKKRIYDQDLLSLLAAARRTGRPAPPPLRAQAASD
jgi:2-isopropylmalate synthase